MLIWADSKDFWINPHTRMQQWRGPGLLHALMMMSDSRAKHTSLLPPLQFNSISSSFYSFRPGRHEKSLCFLPFPSYLLPSYCALAALQVTLLWHLMHQDTNEVGLCQANMTPHPNQPCSGERQEPPPPPPPPHVLHLPPFKFISIFPIVILDFLPLAQLSEVPCTFYVHLPRTHWPPLSLCYTL